jgi:hypothetical protein
MPSVAELNVRSAVSSTPLDHRPPDALGNEYDYVLIILVTIPIGWTSECSAVSDVTSVNSIYRI